MIGTMLRVDNHTSNQSRGNFTRLCVEIDLDHELVPSFTTLGREFFVEYEGLHLICFGCGKYGHRKDNCLSQPGQLEGKPVEEERIPGVSESMVESQETVEQNSDQNSGNPGE